MDIEVRIKAVEERLSEVEAAQRHESNAMQQLLGLVKRIDENMSSVVVRIQALETNFSLLNARVVGIDTKVDDLGSKMDQVLELLRHPPTTIPH